MAIKGRYAVESSWLFGYRKLGRFLVFGLILLSLTGFFIQQAPKVFASARNVTTWTKCDIRTGGQLDSCNNAQGKAEFTCDSAKYDRLTTKNGHVWYDNYFVCSVKSGYCKSPWVRRAAASSLGNYYKGCYKLTSPSEPESTNTRDSGNTASANTESTEKDPSTKESKDKKKKDKKQKSDKKKKAKAPKSKACKNEKNKKKKQACQVALAAEAAEDVAEESVAEPDTSAEEALCYSRGRVWSDETGSCQNTCLEGAGTTNAQIAPACSNAIERIASAECQARDRKVIRTESGDFCAKRWDGQNVSGASQCVDPKPGYALFTYIVDKATGDYCGYL